MSKSSSPSRSREALAGGGGPPPNVDEGGGGGGGDRLVKVAFARSEPEAEMIQGLLREHGIESMLKRGPGFDVPEFLASGPRQVFVLESAAEYALEVLKGVTDAPSEGGDPPPGS